MAIIIDVESHHNRWPLPFLAHRFVQLYPLAQVKKSEVILGSFFPLVTTSNLSGIVHETLLILPSKYIWNATTPYHLQSYHASASHYHLRPGLM